MTKTTHPLRCWRDNQTPRKTLAALARDVGVSPSHLSEIENWNNDPSLELAGRLHTLTGIDMTKFINHREVAQ
jgi:transcriptional regulator with XRE-family HTH domain